MDFRDPQPIYLQIAEYVFEQVLLKNWQQGEKISSIRDMAVTMEVNPNTVQRSYDFLQQQGMIVNKRGVGYFLADDAVEKVKGFRKAQFIKNDLPIFLKNLYLLDIPVAEIEKHYNQFINSTLKNIGNEKKN